MKLFIHSSRSKYQKSTLLRQLLMVAIVLCLSPMTGSLLAAGGWFANENSPDERIPVTVTDGLPLEHLAPVRLTSKALLKAAPGINPASIMVVDPDGKPSPDLPRPTVNGVLLPSAIQFTGKDSWAIDFQVPLKASDKKTVYLYWLSNGALPVSFVRKTHAMHGADPGNLNRIAGIETDRILIEALAGFNKVWAKSRPEMALTRVTEAHTGGNLKDVARAGAGFFGSDPDDRHLFKKGDLGLGGFQLMADKPQKFSLLTSWAEKGPVASRVRLIWIATLPPQGYVATSPQDLQNPLSPEPPITELKAKKGAAAPIRIEQELTACAGDPFVLQTLTMIPPDEKTWELQVGMTVIPQAVEVDSEGWLGQWREGDKKAMGAGSGFGLAMKLIGGEFENAWKDISGCGWIFAGTGKKSFTFVLAGAGAVVAGQENSSDAMMASLKQIDQVLAARKPEAAVLGQPETKPPATIPALTELRGFLFNTTCADAISPVEFVLEDYGFTLPEKSSVTAEVDGKKVECDIFTENTKRHLVVFPAASPRMGRATISLKPGPVPSRKGFQVEQTADKCVVTAVDKRTWTFVPGGLSEVKDAKGRRIQPNEVAPEGESALTILFTGCHLCVVEVGQGAPARQYFLFNESPFWRVNHPAGYGGKTKANLWIARWHIGWGAYPSPCPEWQGTTDLLGVHDWAAIGGKEAQLWMSPTHAAPRIMLSKLPPTPPSAAEVTSPVDDALAWQSTPVTGRDLCSALRHPSPNMDAFIERNALRVGYDPWNCIWQDSALYQSPPRGNTLFALTDDTDAGRRNLVVGRFGPRLLVKWGDGKFAYRADLNGNGCPETFYCLDKNANGPDLVADCWMIDTDSDGSFQSIFQFHPAADGKIAERCENFLDREDFFSDGVVNLQSDESKIPLVVLYDQTRDGIFLTGDIFHGGINDRDCVQWRMEWPADYGTTLQNVLKKEGESKSWIREKLGPLKLHSIDIDGDGDWDINWFGSMPLAYGPIVNYSDIDIITGVIIDPLSGAYFATRGPTGYESPATLMSYCSRIFKDDQDNWRIPHWWDNPQSDVNLDDDPAPEVHWMGQAVVHGKDYVGWTANRMVLDMDNDNGGRPNTPFALTGAYGPQNRGRHYDLDLKPKIFLRHGEGTLRCPPFPSEPAVFKDAFGNVYSSTSPWLAHNWDGKYNPTFDKDGKARNWTFVWQWALQSRWDSIGAVWSPYGDHNPEAMQIHQPYHRPGVRYDQQIGGMTNWHMYRNPLTGFNHLRDAQWGWRSAAGRDNELEPRWDKECYWAIGFDLAQWIHDVDYPRALTVPYEVYFDQCGSGVFDTALLDIENDGVWDRRVWYDKKKGLITLAEKDGFALIPAKPEFPAESLLLDNYKQLVEMYKDTLATRFESWLDKSIRPQPQPQPEKGSKVIPPNPKVAGRLAEPISFFHVIVPSVVMPMVALDTTHAPTFKAELPRLGKKAQRQTRSTAWSDHFLEGYSRLFTAFGRHQVAFKTVDAAWDKASLAGVSLLVLPGVDAKKPFVETEKQALRQWLEGGGLLVVAYPESDAEACRLLNDLLAGYKVNLSSERVTVDFASDEYSSRLLDDLDTVSGFYKKNLKELKLPAQTWQVDKLGCFKGVTKLWYCAGIFTGGAEPVFTDHDKPLAVRAKVGNGAIYAFGSPYFLNNRYTAHCDNTFTHKVFIGTAVPSHILRQGMSPILLQPDNNRYLDQVVDYLCGLLRPAVSVVSADKNTLTIEGKGEIWVPSACGVKINGQPSSGTAPASLPGYTVANLPAGKHVLTGESSK